jgi:hypothetical protein
MAQSPFFPRTPGVIDVRDNGTVTRRQQSDSQVGGVHTHVSGKL